MLFARKKTSLAELPLEEVRFSSEDLFCLLGGNDTCMVACGPAMLRLDHVTRDRPDKDVWRRNLVNRYSPAGWVDDEGNPCPELARVIGALAQMGVAISYDKDYANRKLGVVIGERGAAGIVKAPGFGGGWYLRPFPEDRAEWGARFREIFSPEKFPFDPAAREYHAAFAEPEEENVFQAFVEGDEPYVRAYALRHGLDPDALSDMGGAIYRSSNRTRLFVADYTGCEPDLSMGWRYVAESVGPCRFRRVMLLPEIGAVLSDCNAWHPGMPENWLADVKRYREASGFYSFDFYESGDLFEALSSVPTYPESEATGEDPGLPAR